MALTLKTTGIAANLVAVLVNDGGTIKLFKASDPTNPLTVGAGLTVSGTITAASSSTTYNGNTVYEMQVGNNSRMVVDSPIAWPWNGANGVSCFAAFTSHTPEVASYTLLQTSGNPAGSNRNSFIFSSSRVPGVLCYASNYAATGGTALPASGAFSTGFRYKNSESVDNGAWVGQAGSSGGFSGGVSSGGWTASDGIEYFFNNSSNGTSSDFQGNCIVIALFNNKRLNGATANEDFDALHSDPIGTLFTSVASVTISDAGDEAYNDGETGITITGTNFGTGGGSSAIIISPTDNVADGSAVAQTETGTRTATSATFTAAKGALNHSTNLYLFVRDSAGASNANGHVVQFNAPALTKKLKLLVSSAAIGATVDGVVFAAPVSGIVGAEIGEFTGKTIAAGTGADEGKGVLLIPVTDFGGSALAVFDQPRVYLKNTTHFSPIWPGQVIEE
jgi:hypothetical protein